MSTITTRAGKGSPLTNTEVDANFTNLNTDKAELSGATFTGEIVANAGIALGDNDKAIFGAGSDLQIYHDGSTSYILDDGVGDLQLRSNNRIIIAKSPFEYMADFNADGAVALYYDNAQKLATTSTGIDVTGTATMDGLVVDGSALVRSGNTLTLNRTDNAIGGTMSYVAGTGFIFDDANGDGTSFNIGAIKRMRIATNGDISFYEDTGTTPKLFWDASAESLGIGTSSPAAPLTVSGDTTQIRLENTASGGRNWALRTFGSALGIYDHTAGAFRQYIDSLGNVGFGTSSLTSSVGYETLSINGTTGGQIAFQTGGSGKQFIYSTSTDLSIYNSQAGNIKFTTNSTERMRIDSSGRVGIGITNVGAKLDVLVGGDERLLFTTLGSDPFIGAVSGDNSSYKALQLNGSDLKLLTNGSEKARIDSSGNLLVGKSVNDFVTQGVRLRPHSVQASRDSEVAFHVNRNTSDGDLARFYKDGTTVGSIGSRLTNLYTTYTANGYGLTGTATTNGVIPSLNGGVSNGAVDLGGAAARFKDLHLSNRAYIGSGSLFDTGGDISLNQGSRGIRINDAASAISPTNGGASNSDATTDLGVSNIRFKDLYLSGGVYLGGTGAANKLDDYEEGTFTPTVAGDSTGVIDTGTQGSYYTKVGNLVTIYMNFRVTTNFTSSSIGGLPFQANHPGLTSSWLSCGPTLSSSTNTITAGIQNSTSVIRLYNNQNLSTPHVLNTPNAYHRFVFSYRT